MFKFENEVPSFPLSLKSCGIHIAIGVCCPRRNCWPGFIKGGSGAKGEEGEEEEEGSGKGVKVRNGSSNEELKGVQDAIMAAAGADTEDQTQTTEM